MRAVGRPLLVALAVLGTALAATPTRADASEIVRIDNIGSGARETWVFLPSEDPASCLVVFLHGAADPTPSRVLGWLDHLVIGESCAVVFPRYQLTASTPATALRGLRAGLSTGVQHVRRARYGFEARRSPNSLRTVVVGVGFGGSLAFSYAANAQRWGLPTPVAIDSIFPSTGSIPGATGASIPRSTRVLVQLGDESRSAVAGLRTYLASHPTSHKRFQTIRSRPGLKAAETAPLEVTDAAVNTFWSPLDVLIDGTP
jgi:pimeloyl-ACP methyl ester carboxylesterase